MRTPLKARNEILLEAEALALGETVTVLCPACGGGSSNDKTCSITKNESGAILWICFRDNCQIKGRGGSGKTLAPKSQQAKPKTNKEIRVEKLLKEKTDSIPEALLERALSQYNLVLPEHFIRWTSKYSPEGAGRLAIPIFDKYMDLKGYDLKDITKEQSPKSLTIAGDYTGVAWCMVGFIPTKTLIVVEDLLSANAISALGIDAAALLGTHLSQDKADDINSVGYDQVLIALDKDALATAISLAAEAKLLKNASILPLEKDFKNMDLDERKAIIEEYTTSSEHNQQGSV